MPIFNYAYGSVVTWSRWLNSFHRRGVLQIRTADNRGPTICHLPSMLSPAKSTVIVSETLGAAEVKEGQDNFLYIHARTPLPVRVKRFRNQQTVWLIASVEHVAQLLRPHRVPVGGGPKSLELGVLAFFGQEGGYSVFGGGWFGLPVPRKVWKSARITRTISSEYSLGCSINMSVAASYLIMVEGLPGILDDIHACGMIEPFWF